MQVVIVPTPAEVGRLAAAKIGHLVQSRPDAVLGLATGSSPLAIYDELAARSPTAGSIARRCAASPSTSTSGCRAEHPESYRNVIDTRRRRAAVGIDPAHVQGPDGPADDIPAACAAYEEAIAEAGGVDLQILGIGTDGHIGFNEPGSSLASRTRIKTLTRQTRSDNARFFDDDLERCRPTA